MTDIEIPEGFTRWDGTAEDDDGPEFIRVELLFRNGTSEITSRPNTFSWTWIDVDPDLDIIAYRIVS